VEVVGCENMHVDAVPSKLSEGALRHSRSQNDLTSSSSSSVSPASAERSPQTEPTVSGGTGAGATCVTNCEFDDADCWTQEDDDIIQVRPIVILMIRTRVIWQKAESRVCIC